jgi:hypothetical protein
VNRKKQTVLSETKDIKVMQSHYDPAVRCHNLLIYAYYHSTIHLADTNLLLSKIKTKVIIERGNITTIAVSVSP